VEAVQVTEWDEPQAVIGSYLHRYAYPDFFAEHQQRQQTLETGHSHRAGNVSCLQLRGEYLFAAEGNKGMVVYDVASIANKGVSQRIITAPASSLGQDTAIKSANATCLSLQTTQPIAPERNEGDLMRRVNQEKPFHPLYHYALITDAVEGLILTNIDTLADGEPRNNFLERALTWNEGGVLAGARDITVGGHFAYIVVDAGVAIIDLDKPLQPRHVTTVPMRGARALVQQFRYLFVTDAEGLKVIDITDPAEAAVVPGNTIAIKDAHKVFVARTYAYVAAGAEGIYIVDVTRPTEMQLYQQFTDQLQDARDIVVATTNASLMAYVADGAGGLKIIQLTSPASQPRFYGFSPEPKPAIISQFPTTRPALALSRGLERDRAVDETGGQVAVFSRVGSGPLSESDMRGLYLNDAGKPWFVTDKPETDATSKDSTKDAGKGLFGTKKDPVAMAAGMEKK
jgi:hypothetical protein